MRVMSVVFFWETWANSQLYFLGNLGLGLPALTHSGLLVSLVYI